MKLSRPLRFSLKHPYQAAVRAFSAFALALSVSLFVLEQHYAEPNEGAKPKRERTKEDTDAALALYTLWLTFFTGILAFSTIGLWLTTRKGMADQARDMKRSIEAVEEQSRITNDLFYKDQRPWVSADVSFGEVIPTENGFNFVAKCQRKNIGKSPALRVYTSFLLHFAWEEEEYLFGRVKKLLDFQGGGGVIFGASLLPGEDNEWSKIIEVKEAEVVITNQIASYTKEVSVLLLCYTTYVDTFKDKIKVKHWNSFQCQLSFGVDGYRMPTAAERLVGTYNVTGVKRPGTVICD